MSDPFAPSPGDAEQLRDMGWTRREIAKHLTGIDAAGDEHPADPCPAEPYTELGAARRLAAVHGGILRYVPRWKSWLVWDGRRWKEDGVGCAAECAKDVVRRMSKWALLIPDADAAENAGKASVRMESSRAINGILSLAGTEPGIAIEPDSLDADPWLVNCANGVFDLRTGTLGEHDPALHLTKIARGAYDPDAPRGEFTTFLDRIQPDEEMRAFLQRLFGYSLLGKVVEHVLPIFWGSGGNGKGALIATVSFAAGDYASAADRKLLIDRGESHPTGVADLFGLRLVFCSETDEGVRLAEATMKVLTGGDEIKARRMRENFWRFMPSHTVIMLTNHKPVVKGDDNGVWRRLRLVPFTVQIEDAEKLKYREDHDGREVEAVLQAEADGVLTWMLDGYAKWMAGGLADPAPVKAATAAYRMDSNAMQRWIDECCLVGPAYYAPASELFASWGKWCAQQGEPCTTLTQFGTWLTEHGFAKDEKARPIKRLGIGLLADDAQGVIA